MQEAPDNNGRVFDLVEDHMAAAFHAAKARLYMIAGASKLRIDGEFFKQVHKIVQITAGLVFAPSLQSVGPDIEQIGFSETR